MSEDNKQGNDFAILKESKKESTSLGDKKKFNKEKGERSGPFKPNQNQIHNATFADLLEPFPQFSDMPTMKVDLNQISEFGSRSKNAGVKNNIARATTMGYELIRQCSALNEKTKNHAANELLFAELRKEYSESSESYSTLITHLESLVSQLVEENAALKSTLSKNGIELPAEEEVQKKKPKKAKLPKTKQERDSKQATD